MGEQGLPGSAGHNWRLHRACLQLRRSTAWAVPRLAYPAAGAGGYSTAWSLSQGRAGHRDDYTGEAYMRNHFNHFENGAVVITDNWYIVSPTYYLQHVLGERKDVAVIDKNLLRYPFYLDYVDRQYADVLAPAKEA